MNAHPRLRDVGAPLLAALAGAAMALASVLTALAVSGGGYSYQRQGCSASADRNDRPNSTERGCHNATAQVGVGSWHAASVNTDQTPNNTNVHSGSVVIDDGRGTRHTVSFDTGEGGAVNDGSTLVAWLAGGAQGAPPGATGVGGIPTLSVSNGRSRSGNDLDHPTASVYFGADDNLDVGEHDSVNPQHDHNRDRAVANGPSDGGALQANVHPQGSASHPGSLVQNVDPSSQHDPVRAADAAAGGCADGLCFGADTMRRRMYQGGCRRCADQAVYSDQQSTDWRSPDCNSGSTQNQDDCGRNWQSGNETGDITGPYYERGGYYDDPGVFVYEDPDPQASPVLPLYPICEFYAGTEGLYVCSMPIVPLTVPPAIGAPSGSGAPHRSMPRTVGTAITASMVPAAVPPPAISTGSLIAPSVLSRPTAAPTSPRVVPALPGVGSTAPLTAAVVRSITPPPPTATVSPGVLR